MPPLMHFLFTGFLFVSPSLTWAAECENLQVEGFEPGAKTGNVQIYLNKKSKATLAVQCQPLTVSRQELINEFSKAGKLQKVSEDLFYFQTEVSGVFSRTYLEIGTVTRTISVVTKVQQDMDSVERKIQQALKQNPLAKD